MTRGGVQFNADTLWGKLRELIGSAVVFSIVNPEYKPVGEYYVMFPPNDHKEPKLRQADLEGLLRIAMKHVDAMGITPLKLDKLMMDHSNYVTGRKPKISHGTKLSEAAKHAGVFFGALKRVTGEIEMVDVVQGGNEHERIRDVLGIYTRTSNPHDLPSFIEAPDDAPNPSPKAGKGTGRNIFPR